MSGTGGGANVKTSEEMIHGARLVGHSRWLSEGLEYAGKVAGNSISSACNMRLPRNRGVLFDS